MIGNERVGVKLQVKPLVISNPFAGSERRQLLYKEYYNPIVKEGFTSADAKQRMAVMKKIQQMKNAGMLDEKYGIDVNQLMQDAYATSEGVASVEARDRLNDAMRTIERANAGIYDAENAKKRKLYELVKEKERKENRLKAIQYLAESDELDQVPEEFQEEVEKWYRGAIDPSHVMVVQEDGFSREKVDPKYIGLYDDKEVDNFNQRQKLKIETLKKRREKMERRKRREEASRAKTLQDFYDQRIRERSRLSGHGAVCGGKVLMGWKAKPISAAPYFHSYKMLQGGPEQKLMSVRDQIHENRELYKRMMKFKRGDNPPNAMVKRAFPDLALPMDIQAYNEVDMDAPTELPFVFKKKKYTITTI